MLKRTILLTIAALMTTPAAAEELTFDLDRGSGTTSVEAEGEWQSPQLTIYANSCDVPFECALVGLTCESGLRVSIEGVDDAILARWLNEPGEMTIVVEGLDTEGNDPLPIEMTRSDLFGGWSVVFQVDYSSDPGLTIVGDKLSIVALPSTSSVDLQGDNLKRLQEFVQLCASE